ncbi:ammonia transport outward protein 2-like [Rhizophagus diaphanus]|nr:ammonia transport outward protein 2-like [Rhizophagus diaphanus] [Rhizophagus sp. MUCL 43196]
MSTIEERKCGEDREVTPKVASAGPLGMWLCAFALSVFVLSINNVGSSYLQLPNIAVGLALTYGGIVQICAGWWDLTVGNSFGATAFCSYGALWLSYAANFLFNLTDFLVPDDPFAVDHAIGISLIGWEIWKFFQLSEDLKGPNGLTKAGGVFGIFVALTAWYNAFAGLITLENSYFTLPVYDLSRKNK